MGRLRDEAGAPSASFACQKCGTKLVFTSQASDAKLGRPDGWADAATPPMPPWSSPRVPGVALAPPPVVVSPPSGHEAPRVWGGGASKSGVPPPPLPPLPEDATHQPGGPAARGESGAEGPDGRGYSSRGVPLPPAAQARLEQSFLLLDEALYGAGAGGGGGWPSRRSSLGTLAPPPRASSSFASASNKSSSGLLSGHLDESFVVLPTREGAARVGGAPPALSPRGVSGSAESSSSGLAEAEPGRGAGSGPVEAEAGRGAGAERGGAGAGPLGPAGGGAAPSAGVGEAGAGAGAGAPAFGRAPSPAPPPERSPPPPRRPAAPREPRVPLSSRLDALSGVLAAASDAAAVDLPLCTSCVGEARRALEQALAEAREEGAAYERALAALDGGRGGRRRRARGGAGRADRGSDGSPPSSPGRSEPEEAGSWEDESGSASDEAASEASAAALAEAEAELAGERAALEEARAELGQARAEVAALRAAGSELAALEARQCRDLDAFALAHEAHVEERDGLAHKIERARARLARLRRTNVYGDAFRIWFDGPFGTIAGLRLGRTSAHHVPWDEINAAWGAAVLLLHSLRRETGAPEDPGGVRLLPMGSYPRVTDGRGTCDLFGPVSKLLCAGYDRAQVGFLQALASFAEWLASEGRRISSGTTAEGPGAAAGPSPPRPAAGSPSSGLAASRPGPGPPPPLTFLPWSIEGDKIGTQSIRYQLSKDSRWTRALKCMLVDLKYCCREAVEYTERTGRYKRPGAGPAT